MLLLLELVVWDMQPKGCEIAQEFRKRGKIVIMGGPMVSLVPEIAKKFCDAVVVGDSEEVWNNVLKDIENNDLKPFYQNQLRNYLHHYHDLS